MENITLGSGRFMALDENDKKNIPDDFLRGQSPTFLEYYDYLLQGGFDELDHELLSLFNLSNWWRYSDDDIVGNTLPSSEKDRIVKSLKREYYLANAYCAVNVLRRIFTQPLYDSFVKMSSVYYSTYYQILREIMFDIHQLKNMYRFYVLKDTHYIHSENGAIHAIPLHNTLRQALYGNISFHSFADYESCSSIAIIRQIIELRIRRAIGVLATCQNKSVYPLAMSTVFQILEKYDISFSCRLSSIKLIYEWGNLFIHSGRKDWAWIAFFLEKYLKPLSFGNPPTEKGFNCNDGIKMSKSTLEAIQNDILDDVHKKFPQRDLYRCDPQCVLLDA